MNKQINYVFFSFFFLFSSLLIIQHYDYLNRKYATIIVPIIIFLIVFSAVIIMVSQEKTTALYFGGMLSLITLYCVLDLVPWQVAPISNLIISFLSYLLYRFFTLFNSLPSSIEMITKRTLLFFLSVTNFILLSIDFKMFKWGILLEVAVSLLCCGSIYLKEKDYLSASTRKEQKLLVKSFIFALMPFILSYSLFTSIFSTRIKLYSLIFILVIPITVGVILIQRKETRIDNHTVFITILTAISSIFIFLGINHFFLQISKKKLLFVLILYFLLLYIIYLRDQHLHTLKLKKIQQSKNAFQKEKIDLIQRITKEEFLSSMSILISNLLLQNYSIDSHLIIWNEHEKPYILSSTGILSQVKLTDELIHEMKKEKLIFYFQNQSFTKFPLNHGDEFLGWFVVGNNVESKLTLTEHEIIKELSLSIGEIIRINERLYNIKHENLSIESFKYDEYIHYEYLNMVQNFHKNFAMFIHDNVLQNFLALKKLTETLKTDQFETKELLLVTYDSLNKLFRDKMFELYPSTIEHYSLSQSIEILCDKFNKDQKTINIKFDCLADIRLEKELKFHLYRINQELITNALKHSQAQEIHVSLFQIGSYIKSVVQDNGVGLEFKKIEVNTLGSENFGLLSIIQEINSLNGELQISSVEPHGTKIIVTIPIPKEN